MKRILLFLSALFIATTAIAHTINWYVDGNIFHTTTCESGENVTPPTAPEKYGYTFQGWGSYIPIEYLESTGTQYIDTGILPKSAHTKVVVEASCTSNDQQWGKFVFGSRNGELSITNAFCFSFFNERDNKNLRCQYGNSGYRITSSYSLLDKKVVFKLDKNVFTVKDDNGNTIGTQTMSLVDFTGLYSMTLFAWNTGGTIVSNQSANVRIYSCQIYEDNVLLIDLIPVLDKYGTPCMYDLVEHKFYYNAGTGDFIAGPIIGE